MKCRSTESVELSRRLLEDEVPPEESGEVAPEPAAAGDLDDFASGSIDDLMSQAVEGIRLPPGEPGHYAYTMWRERLGRRNSRKLENNTYLILDPHDKTISIRLHYTDIITMHPDGSFEVNNGGWQTKTTLRRLNDYLPGGWSVYTHDGTWYWAVHGKGHIQNQDPEGRTLQPYENHDHVDAQGVLHPRRHAFRMRPLRPRRSRYA